MMVQRLEKIQLTHPQTSVMYSTNVTDCLAMCQSQYTWCFAVSHQENDNLCHLMGGGLEDLDIHLTVDTAWTTLVTYAKGNFVLNSCFIYGIW